MVKSSSQRWCGRAAGETWVVLRKYREGQTSRTNSEEDEAEWGRAGSGGDLLAWELGGGQGRLLR